MADRTPDPELVKFFLSEGYSEEAAKKAALQMESFHKDAGDIDVNVDEFFAKKPPTEKGE